MGYREHYIPIFSRYPALFSNKKTGIVYARHNIPFDIDCKGGYSFPVKSKSHNKTVSGTVQKVVFSNPETGYGVIRLTTDKGNLITVVGILDNPRPGEHLIAEGRWKIDPNWGRQFEAEKCRIGKPTSTESLRRYLASDLVDGVGPEYARRLVEHFGDDVIDIIRENPDRLLEVEGIGPVRAERLKESILGEDREKRIIRELSTRLMDLGIGLGTIRKIYKHYKNASLDILKSDPYRLITDIWGIGFSIADRMAKKVGIPKDSPSRIKAGLLHVLRNAINEGHCYLPKGGLLDRAKNLLETDKDIEPILQSMLDEGQFIEATEGIYPVRLHFGEIAAANKVVNLLNSKSPTSGEKDVKKGILSRQKEMGIQFTSEQSKAIKTALCGKPVLVITGGPGTGKTTIIRAVSHIASKSGMQPVLCAPTGRAAKRLSEAAEMPAYTIHRLLEYTPRDGFGRGQTRPIPANFVIVDEMSMVDIELFSALLSAINKGSRFLLVGDSDQLQSVGPGQVLSDLIESREIPVIRLTQIHRQAASSRIVTESHNILRGQIPDLRNDPDGDFFFLREDDPDIALETIVDLVSHRLPSAYGFDPKEDIQVIVPMYRGSCGANSLNQALKEKLNPGKAIPPFKFKPGDKVMQTRNNYELDIFNGDIGVVSSINPDDEELTIRFDRPVKYSTGDVSDLTAAYAITVHKSQGSEFPCVILPLLTEHYIMLRRHLLYTAVTRAKKICVLVGQVKALGIATRRSSEGFRYTGLARKIKARASQAPVIPGI